MPRGVQNVVPNAFENSSQHSGSFGSDSAMKKKSGSGAFTTRRPSAKSSARTRWTMG